LSRNLGIVISWNPVGLYRASVPVQGCTLTLPSGCTNPRPYVPRVTKLYMVEPKIYGSSVLKLL